MKSDDEPERPTTLWEMELEWRRARERKARKPLSKKAQKLEDERLAAEKAETDALVAKLVVMIRWEEDPVANAPDLELREGAAIRILRETLEKLPLASVRRVLRVTGEHFKV